MKRVTRNGEQPLVPEIPPLLGLRVVAVQPPLVIIVVHLEDVRVAVGVGSCAYPSGTPSFEYSRD